MMDSKNRAVFPIISETITKRISGINNARALKVFLCIYRNILIQEKDIVAEMKISSTRLIQKDLRSLCKSKLVTRYTDNKFRVVYTVSQDIIIENLKCHDCSQANMVSQDVKSDKTVKYYECSANFDCSYNYFRVAQAAIRKYKILCGLEASEDFSHIVARGNTAPTPKTLPSDFKLWGRSEFSRHIKVLYNTHYPHIVDIPGMAQISKIAWIPMKTFFVTEFPNDWQYRLKRYLDYMFEYYAKNKELLSLYNLRASQNMLDFVRNNSAASIRLCGTYGIYCPFWKKNTCKLIEASEECTQKIRKKMIRHYN